MPAPISGRIGRSLVTPGALVTANQADPIAQINQLDPIYVDIQQSASELLTLRKLLARGGASPTSADVRLVLEDGSNYDVVGHVQFAEAIVDEATGTVTLRAEFANPQGWLLPGMFVRARFNQAVDKGAYLVPQAAITRDDKGDAQLFIAGKDNKAELRTVTAPRTQGGFWIVSKGLKPGDRIIVQGTADLKDGQAIKPVPADSPQKVAPKRQDGKNRRGRLKQHAVPHLHRPANSRLGARDDRDALRHRRDFPRCRSRNIPTSRRHRSTSRPIIPAPRPKPCRTASPRSSSNRSTALTG